MPAAVARAQASAKAVEALAQRHADAINASAGKAKGDKLEDAAWVGHLPIFLRDFEGVPAATTLATAWKPRLTAHTEAAKGLADFWKLRERDIPKAFAKGIDIARTAFLMEGGLPSELTTSLAKWRKQSAAKKIDASAVKSYDDTLPILTRALDKGRAAAAALNKR